MKKVRPASFSGRFYPSDKCDAIKLINGFERRTEHKVSVVIDEIQTEKISGLIIPHAGWIYSGQTATISYKILADICPDKIALLGPSHGHWTDEIFADDHDYWETPFGNVKIYSDKYFKRDKALHQFEHSLEVHAPFIKYYSGDSSILPIVIGEISDNLVKTAARHLIDNNYFLIISSDLSHFHTLRQAGLIDQKTISGIENLSIENMEACGINPLRIAFEVCKLKDARPKLLDYSTSAEASGNTDSVVGYAAFYF